MQSGDHADATADGEGAPEVHEAGGAARRGRQRRTGLLVSVALVALLVVQIVVLVLVVRTTQDVDALRDEVAALGAVSLDTGAVTELGSGPASPGPSVASEPSDASPLPRFLGGGVDPAVGTRLGQLAGLEYYRGSSLVVDPADGMARATMVWAHWCPFCQEELPVMVEWVEENGDSVENFEVVTVTTAMDETAGNPLVPYLDESQFPFPVLVDEDGSLARQLGVNAFPFWVFTAPDGTVVGRAAGLIESAELSVVFEQLEEMGAEAASAMAVSR